MVILLAISPATEPPTPSATASRRGPAYIASSLPSRTSPTWVLAPNRQPPQHWSSRTVRPIRICDPAWTSFGAVTFVASSSVPLVEPRSSSSQADAVGDQPGVVARDVVVVDDDRRVLGAPDRQRQRRQGERRAGERTVDDGDAGRWQAAWLRRSCRASAGRAGLAGLRRALWRRVASRASHRRRHGAPRRRQR